MKFSLALAALAGTAVASNWFGTKPLYNKWHETELERWLSDNNVPYPTPADRKDLEDLIKTNWDANVVQPYNSWETPQLSKYIQAKGKQVKKGTEQNKDSLIAQVKSAWTETEQQATDAYESVKDWIFDTWSESQLKAFLDRHGVPNPQPRTRDSLLSSARENYQTVAEKASEYSHYPGAWLYQSWSDSDLKAWLDARGIPVPQPSNRDKLTAAVRRNSHVAAGNAAYYADAAASSASSAGYGAASSASSAGYEAASSLSSAGSAATQAVADVLLDTWSESQIKEWCDKNGVKVPQGSKKNELLALARRKYAQLSGDNVSASAASAYGAATSKAGNQYAQATDMAGQQGQQLQQYAYEWFNWAKMQLGIASQSASSYVSASGHSAATAASASAFSAASMIKNSAYSVAYQAQVSAESAYSLASASASSASLSATDAAGSSASSAAVAASKSAYSASSLASKSYSSVSSSLSSAASSASVSASKAAAKSGPKVAKQAGDAAAESLSYGKHRVQEAIQKATDYVKEEL